MNTEYIGLKEVNGPLVIIEGVKEASYEETVEIKVNDNEVRQGRIIEINEEFAVVQVFEGTRGLSVTNTVTKFTGEPLKFGLSKEILGRVFDGVGRPIDGLGRIKFDKKLDVNGMAMNPVAREYPRNYIHVGISAIDGLTTLIRGQKLPIFSSNGMPHNQLAAQIVRQAKIGDGDQDNFAIVFAAMGASNDVAEYFRKTFEESGVSRFEFTVKL